MKTIYCYFLVVSMPVLAQTINPVPSREFGQPALLPLLNSVAPNLVEGRELNGPAAMAFDTKAAPPILYVADLFNNRVLGFQNPDNFTTCIASGPTCGFAQIVIGQRDLTSTLPQGPGGGLSTGLYLPTAVAVDANGNLYVADSGNNRVLRFPSPFKQPAATQPGVLFTVDLVIGQQSVSSGNIANQGQAAPSATTLSLTPNGTFYRGGLAIDPAGNLWVSDPGNNRVLRFPNTNGSVQTTADVVLGQLDFVSSAVLPAPSGVSAQLYNSSLAQPSGLTFDSAGNLYVADAYSRVQYYTPPFSTGVKSQRILGVNTIATQQSPSPPYPNQYTLGMPSGNSLIPPEGVFTDGTHLFVADTGANRIVAYDVPANWPAATATQPSPPILSTIPVIGQNNNTSGQANKGQAQPDATTLNAPVAGAFLGSELWAVDAANNRVLAFPRQGASYTAATRLVGQLDFPFNAVNLIEGREVYFPFSSGIGAAGLVVDGNSTPPHLYVADTANNRILGFKDARTVQQGSHADIVIGQPDFFHSVLNYTPNGNEGGGHPNNTGLQGPVGVAVDSAGDLYVADSGNGRVVRFPAPFGQPAGVLQQANLVLGQSSFTSQIFDASSETMHTPFGIAVLSDGSVAVSDAIHNRVLLFKRPQGADFTNGQAAATVFGQPDFESSQPSVGNSSSPPSTSGLNGPRHIAVDTSDRLYVCDTGNDRVLIFTNSRNAANGVPSSYQITSANSGVGLSTPQGIAVSPLTGESWVADANAGMVYRFPEFDTLLTTGAATASIASQTPLAVALDAANNVVVAEAANRVTFFFAALAFQNAANYNSQPLAPGMLAVLYSVGKNFNFTSASASSLPWPTVLSDVQVLVNGTPAPVFAIGPISINIQVPSGAPSSGSADFVVTHPSTGEIIAAGTVPMAQQSPGFFTSNEQGTGQIAAFNTKDGTINGPGNPVARGDILALCLTGAGLVPGAPPDGAAPGSNGTPAAPPTPIAPVVITDAGTLDSSVCSAAPGGQCVQYSGLGCGFPGLWQINVFIPDAVPPTPTAHEILVLYNDEPSNIGPGAARITTTFSVK